MAHEPVIQQIQNAVLDSTVSLSNTLRKAKVVCAKLGLTDFERWVDLELNGYMDEPVENLPAYRVLNGTPRAFNPHHGWQPIIFNSAKQMDEFSSAPVGMSVGAIEASKKDTRENQYLVFPYSGGRLEALREFTDLDVHIQLSDHHAVGILEAVRNILLQWTIDLQRNGIDSANLSFDAEERAISHKVTEKVINEYHIQIGQVGSIVQNAKDSNVSGAVSSGWDTEKLGRLIAQIEAFKAELPENIEQALEPHLETLRQELSGAHRPKTISSALQSIRTVCEGAAGNLIAMGIIGLLGTIK